jgi:hypothetical protein
VCQQGQCAEGAACVPDAQEPNEDTVSASSIEFDEWIDATLCADDVDVFALNIAAANVPDGALIVELRHDPSQVGVSEVSVEILSQTGMVLASGSVEKDGNGAGALSLHYVVPVNQMTTLFVRVRGAQTLPSGLVYQLRAQLVPASLLAACQLGRTLPERTIVRGDLSDAAASSTILASSCGNDFAGMGREQVWSFTLSEPRLVTLEAPLAGRQRRALDP